MKKFTLIALILVILGLIALWSYPNNQPNNQPNIQLKDQPNSITTPSQSPEVAETNFTASFEIYTYSTKRIFTQAMYHNQSPDVYIEGTKPNIIHIKKTGVTWDDFFETLPFSLTKDCLITGTKQTFCTTETQKLRFFINGVENPDALDDEINENDMFKVTYGN